MIRVTFTGVDSRTHAADIWRLQERGAELAVLVSAKPEGRPRYPDMVLDAILDEMNPKKTAIHICGREAHRRLMDGAYDHLLLKVDRVQINGQVSAPYLRRLCQRHTGIEFITQISEANAPLLEVKQMNHSLLVDGSGGRGIAPSEWVYPVTTKPVGFAGGLGPHNIRAELPKILQASREGAWIDMETHIRTDDWFDASKAEDVLDTIYQAMP